MPSEMETDEICDLILQQLEVADEDILVSGPAIESCLQEMQTAGLIEFEKDGTDYSVRLVHRRNS